MLDLFSANSPAIVAGPLAEVTKAAIAIIEDDTIFATAASAGEQA
jgi:hypothetical protein